MLIEQPSPKFFSFTDFSTDTVAFVRKNCHFRFTAHATYPFYYLRRPGYGRHSVVLAVKGPYRNRCQRLRLFGIASASNWNDSCEHFGLSSSRRPSSIAAHAKTDEIDSASVNVVP